MVRGLILGGLLSTLVVVAAYRARALNRSGALAAWVVGVVIFGCGGLVGAAALLTFFVSSSAFSKMWMARKQTLVVEYAKGGERDWGQVLANGGLATVLAGLACGWRAPSPAAVAGLVFAFVGALAAATADTWATEIGGLYPTPRLITTGRRVASGTSGGVSPLGLLASLGGGAVIGLVAWVAVRGPWAPAAWNRALAVPVWMVVMGAALAGLAGSLVDSVLGATVQQVYWCPTCDKETERRVHRCGTPTRPVRGWAWMSNDVVNFVGTVVGSIIAAFTVSLFLG